MVRIGRYCKAFPNARFEAFHDWPRAGAAGREPSDASEEEGGFLFLQENYTVTAGVAMDEGVVFDTVTPEWIDFCRDQLGFEPPEA